MALCEYNPDREANARAPSFATVFDPSSWSKERSSFFASSRCLTKARNARSRDPSSTQRANSLKTPV